MKKQTDVEKKIAERVANEEFNTVNEIHEFSQSYTKRKEKFLSSLTEDKKKTWTTKRLIAVAIMFLIIVPTTVYAATELYQWYVTQKEYKLTLSLTGGATKDDTYYKLNLGYLPDNMNEDLNADNKYSYTNNPDVGAFSFVLWKIKNKVEFTELNTKDYQEVTYGDNKGYLINREGFRINEPGGFSRIVYLFFEKEGYVVESYVGNDVSLDELEKVLSNLTLKESSQEEASSAIDYEAYKKDFDDEPRDDGGIEISKLPTNSSNIYKIGDVVEVNPLSDISFNFIVNKVEIFDNITDMNLANFRDDDIIEEMKEKHLISEDLSLKNFKQKVIKLGNGETTIDEVVGEKNVTPKFVYLTATIENPREAEISELFMQNSPQLLKEDGKNFIHANSSVEDVDYSVFSGEVDYFDNHGEGESYYQMPTIKGKEKRVIHFGFFMEEEKLNQMMLPVFNYSNPEDLSDTDAKWIDIRQ